MKMLNVRPKPGVMVSNVEAQEAGVLRYIGYTADKSDPARIAFVMSDDVVSVPANRHYVTAVKDGDLLPADAEAAKACGVPFPQSA